jgi:hemoglobin-like flavoprotein
VKEHADEVYVNKLRNNEAVFASFYRKLFEYSEEIAKLFGSRRVSMDDQYRKLDRAMGTILAFNQRLRTTTLEPHVETHGHFALRAEHFGFFREAFLGALRETPDLTEYSLEAWSAVLDPALTYMRDKTCIG